MHRSEITIDLGGLRRNVRTLIRALDGAQLWAVVKANGYGHGAVDAAGAALGAGAHALCVVTVAEALELRREFPTARILCFGPVHASRELAEARDASLELMVSDTEIPEEIGRSQEAFFRDLPGLLQDRRLRGQWVAYRGDERVKVGRSQRDVILEW